MNIFQRYAHVFWIPLFPIGKTGISQCTFCKQVLKLKEMPLAIRLGYDNMKAASKTPFWTFAGGAFMVLMIILVNVNDLRKPEKISKMLLSPRINDIYEIKQKNNSFTLLKVQRITPDSLFLIPNKYETTETSGLSDLMDRGDTSYDNKNYYMFSKSILYEMNKKGDIIDIDRK